MKKSFFGWHFFIPKIIYHLGMKRVVGYVVQQLDVYKLNCMMLNIVKLEGKLCSE